jgi:hypothetical protein
MPRGRSPGFQMSDEHRVKIKNSNILNALIEHVEGTREMSSTQVTAGLGLLRKVMPDLSQTDVNHTVKRDATDYSREELAAILAKSHATNGGGGIDAEDGCAGEPDSIH